MYSEMQLLWLGIIFYCPDTCHHNLTIVWHVVRTSLLIFSCTMLQRELMPLRNWCLHVVDTLWLTCRYAASPIVILQILLSSWYNNSCSCVHNCGCKGTTKLQLLQRVFLRMLTTLLSYCAKHNRARAFETHDDLESSCSFWLVSRRWWLRYFCGM